MDNDEDEFEILPELTPEEAQRIEQEHIERLDKFYSETSPYTIENWYQPLQKFTFESHSFPLTNLEAHLLNLLYQENPQAQQQLYQEAKAKLT